MIADTKDQKRGRKASVPSRPGVREPPPRVPAEDRGREGSQSTAEKSRRDAAIRPPLPSEGPRSSRPHPGPLRRGQRRSIPGCLCPAPGPQLRSHGNQAGLRCTPARPPRGACVHSLVSRVPAGDGSGVRTFRVAFCLRREKRSGPRLCATLSGRSRCDGQSSSSGASRVRCRYPAMCGVLSQPKSVKLRALHSACKFGVAARSCQELLHKGCVRFQVARGFRAGTAGPWLPPVLFPSPWMGLNGRWAPVVRRCPELAVWKLVLLWDKPIFLSSSSRCPAPGCACTKMARR